MKKGWAKAGWAAEHGLGRGPLGSAKNTHAHADISQKTNKLERVGYYKHGTAPQEGEMRTLLVLLVLSSRMVVEHDE